MNRTASSEVAGLLCDLDGVLRLWPADHVDAAESLAGLPHGSIHATTAAEEFGLRSHRFRDAERLEAVLAAA